MRVDKLNKAKEYLTRAVHLGKNEMSYVALAKLCLREGDFKQAIDIYNAGLQYVYPIYVF